MSKEDQVIAEQPRTPGAKSKNRGSRSPAAGSRTAYRGRTTILLNEAEKIMGKFVPNNPELLRRLNRCSKEVQSKIDIMKALDAQILMEAADEQEEIVMVTKADEYYSEKVYPRLDDLDAFIENLKSKPDSKPCDKSSHHNQHPAVRLPNIELVPFDGSVLQWVSFYDSFTSSMKQNPTLSGIQKLQLLRSHVSGPPAKTIASLTLSNENYDKAMKQLKSRYGKPHKVIEAYMDAFLDMPNPSADTEGLRHFYDLLEGHISSLETMKVTPDSYGTLLIAVIMRKLPAIIRKTTQREHGDKAWTFDELMAALARELTTEHPYIGEIPIAVEMPTTTAVFHTSATNVSTARYSTPTVKKEKSCIFCKGPHFPNDCTIVTDPEKRNNFVKQNRLCFNCLGKHKVVDCKSKGTCRKCSKRHHTSLCGGNSKSSTAVTESTRGSTATPRPIEPKPQGAASNAVSNTAIPTVHVNFARTEPASSNQEDTILKTAIAPITAGHNTTNITILFDEGSNRTYISRELVTK